MCDMAVRHDETVVAHNGFAFAGGASVDGGALADGGVVADEDVGLLPFELEVLRDSSHYCGGEDMAVLADACAFEDGGISVNDGACTNFHVFINVHERTDLYGGVHFGFGMDIVHNHIILLRSCLQHWVLKVCPGRRAIMRPWIRHPSSDMSPMRSSSLWREGSFW